MTLLRYLMHDLRKALLTRNGQRGLAAVCAAIQVWTLTLHEWWSWWQAVPIGCLLLLAWAQVRLERAHVRLDAATANLAAAKVCARVDPPVRPEGVVVLHPDGSTTPVELAYRGRNDEGVHVWAGAVALRPGDEVQAEVLPPNSALALPFDGR